MDKSVLKKIAQYCVYQERCHKEVLTKLSALKVFGNDQEEIIAYLIEENFLNEGRYAIQFATGKFRMKHWGKLKIKIALQYNNISEECIQTALDEISEFDYLETLRSLFAKKIEALHRNETDIFMVRQKARLYLAQKGFELDKIQEISNIL